MGITLDGITEGGGQIVESQNFGVSPGTERQIAALGGFDNVLEIAKVKAVDPGNAAYAVATRNLPRMTTSNPNITGRYTAGTQAIAIAANANRLNYSVENDDTGGDGLVYVMEGATASATVWVTRLAAGERWNMLVWTGKLISVFVTGSAVAHCVEWIP